MPLASLSTPSFTTTYAQARIPRNTLCRPRASDFWGSSSQIRSRIPALGLSSEVNANGTLQTRRSLPLTTAASTDTRVKLQITVQHQVNFGDTLGVLGSPKWFGKWKDPVEMCWTEAGWTVEIDARPGEEAEFKFVVMGDGKSIHTWEGGPNRRFAVPSDAAVVKVAANWDSTTEGLNVLQKEGSQNGSAMAAPSSSPRGYSSSSDSEGEASAFAQSWQGREVSFMRSNNHRSDRQGRWDTSGLSGSALTLVEGDRHAGNWWRKLEVVQNLLTPLSSRSEMEPLVHCAMYLQWINTGQIACVEDGGHHRPNRHASIAREIFRWLERDSAQQALKASPQAVLVTRKIHPRLPAFTAEFTASVPLTRIRDIAHRNDIPHDLKQEIKHTIQNKLHRCAGPEDLVATEMLLQRVSAQEGQYSAGFVEQLRIFYRELKDFFNAASLTEQLEGIRSSLDEQTLPMLDAFLSTKRSVDSLGAQGDSRETVDLVLAALHALTGLRAGLLYHLQSGLRNDASDDAVAMRQKWRLSEIGLEDYSFVLLSRLINEADSLGGSGTMAQEAEGGTPRLFDACVGGAVLALRQVGLSGWAQAECMSLEQELAQWQKAGVGAKQGGGVVTAEDLHWWALRFKASLDRAKRLTASYSETLLSLYARPAQVLGNALGIEENAVRTFAEAEIRASVVFQLDKLLTMLLKSLRFVLKSEGWDVLMPGTACGTIVEVDTIDPARLEQCPPETVLLVHRAEGDEEVKAAGNQVKAVILLQELPHLSHLAVRARQERVPFVTCEDQDWIQKLKSAASAHQRVKLEASGEGVRMTIPAPAEAPATNGAALPSASAPTPVSQPAAANRAVTRPLIPLSEATLDLCGAKAVSCARILTISQDSLAQLDDEGAFHACQGAVIPFGMLEETVRQAGKHDEYVALVEDSEKTPLHHLEEKCTQLRDLVKGLSLPSNVLDQLSSTFPPSTRLIVRSSANVEDLAGMSGAGLYDSIPNVQVSDPAALNAAITGVWASLYSRRAVLSRRTAGVRQADACMAVLIQELMSPDVSFVLHTKSLVDGTSHEVHAEVAPGLGETLASGARGTAWRFAVAKATGELSLSAMANFSEQFVALAGGPGDGTVSRVVVDYSKHRLSVDRDDLKVLGKKLAKVGEILEVRLGGAQDIEGCVVGVRTVIVQSRPQP